MPGSLASGTNCICYIATTSVLRRRFSRIKRREIITIIVHIYKTQGILNELREQYQGRFKSSGMLRCVNSYVLTDASKERSFKTSVTIYQSTRRNIPTGLNYQQYRCENLQHRMILRTCWSTEHSEKVLVNSLNPYQMSCSSKRITQMVRLVYALFNLLITFVDLKYQSSVREKFL